MTGKFAGKNVRSGVNGLNVTQGVEPDLLTCKRLTTNRGFKQDPSKILL